MHYDIITGQATNSKISNNINRMTNMNKQINIKPNDNEKAFLSKISKLGSINKNRSEQLEEKSYPIYGGGSRCNSNIIDTNKNREQVRNKPNHEKETYYNYSLYEQKKDNDGNTYSREKNTQLNSSNTNNNIF